MILLLNGITLAMMRHNNPVQLGSPCRIVENDEWLKENISTNCARALGMKLLRRKSLSLMLPITRQWFCLRTTLWSYVAGNNDLDQNGYEHQTVNHKPDKKP